MRPIQFQSLAFARHGGLAEGNRLFPLVVVVEFLDFQARIFQGENIAFAGMHEIFHGVVEQIEIVGKTRGIVRGVQHESSCEVAGLAAIANDQFQHGTLKFR